MPVVYAQQEVVWDKQRVEGALEWCLEGMTMGGEEVAEKGEKVNITLCLTALLLKGTERKLGIWNLDHSDATVDASHSSGHGVNTDSRGRGDLQPGWLFFRFSLNAPQIYNLCFWVRPKCFDATCSTHQLDKHRRHYCPWQR